MAKTLAAELDMSKPNQFTFGFVTGMILGAGGYFLFGTDKGAKVRKRLNTEWESARESIAESEAGQQLAAELADEPSLSELVDRAKDWLITTFEFEDVGIFAEDEVESSAGRKKRQPKKRQKTFKGV